MLFIAYLYFMRFRKCDFVCLFYWLLLCYINISQILLGDTICSLQGRKEPSTVLKSASIVCEGVDGCLQKQDNHLWGKEHKSSLDLWPARRRYQPIAWRILNAPAILALNPLGQAAGLRLCLAGFGVCTFIFSLFWIWHLFRCLHVFICLTCCVSSCFHF
jgi:hypothetical protein